MEVLVLLVIFGSITMWIRMRNQHAERMAEIEAAKIGRLALPQGSSIDPASQELIDQRLAHLESIVCSVDFELNAKINRLASRQLQVAPPAVHGGAPTVTRGPGPDAPTAEVSPQGKTAPSLGLKPGDCLADRFTVERVLGHGGMGSVFLARDKQLGESVAVKVIGGFALLDPAAAGRMRREVSTARRISHPNIVRIHDIGESGGVLFLSMEYVAGPSLLDMLSRYGRLPPRQVRELFSQICDGLEAAHAEGVIHRDLKPGNILTDDQQRVKIIDFGIARTTHAEGMTSTGVILGTPEYMAPEQVKGGIVDARTDIYALGAVLYHALCGRPPFAGSTPIAVSLSQLKENPAPPRTHVPDLDEAWEKIVLKALAKDPAHRFQSARALRDALPIQ